MFEISTDHLTILLAAYGYLAVLGFVAVESMGVPVPGEAMLIVTAAYAGTTCSTRLAALSGTRSWARSPTSSGTAF